VVPRYGSVGASGDLMPSAYIARVLVGMGEAEFQGRRMPAVEALAAAGLQPMRFAPKEALALINGTTVMTAVAALVWLDAFRVLRALLGAVALSVEALQAPEPAIRALGTGAQRPSRTDRRGRVPARIIATAPRTPRRPADRPATPCAAPAGPRTGVGGARNGRATVEREINSANDNPLIDPETGRMYKAGNFYGGHIARLLDTWKIDFAAMANWGNALMAVLVDDRFSGGLPMNLTPQPGVNCGFKGMQLSVTSLACAVRQMAGPSSIHSLPTEQYNQDVVSLGMHAAVTAMDALECVRNETAMLLLAASQAVDLRGGPAKLGVRLAAHLRAGAPGGALPGRRPPMEHEVAAVAGADRGRSYLIPARIPVKLRAPIERVSLVEDTVLPVVLSKTSRVVKTVQ
jgi:phenylalanine ammonia-lyase